MVKKRLKNLVPVPFTRQQQSRLIYRFVGPLVFIPVQTISPLLQYCSLAHSISNISIHMKIRKSSDFRLNSWLVCEEILTSFCASSTAVLMHIIISRPAQTNNIDESDFVQFVSFRFATPESPFADETFFVLFQQAVMVRKRYSGCVVERRRSNFPRSCSINQNLFQINKLYFGMQERNFTLVFVMHRSS